MHMRKQTRRQNSRSLIIFLYQIMNCKKSVPWERSKWNTLETSLKRITGEKWACFFFHVLMDNTGISPLYVQFFIIAFNTSLHTGSLKCKPFLNANDVASIVFTSYSKTANVQAEIALWAFVHQYNELTNISRVSAIKQVRPFIFWNLFGTKAKINNVRIPVRFVALF